MSATHRKSEQQKPSNKPTQTPRPGAVPAAGPSPHDIVQRALADPHGVPAHELLSLQHTLGNQAVGRLLSAPHQGTTRPPAIQPKLTVGAAHDPYEQEAERVAAQVVSTPAPSQAGMAADGIAHAAPPGFTNKIDRRAESLAGSFEAEPAIESRVAAGRDGGSPLPDPVRMFMEPRFGANFGHVRLHSGGEPAQLNRQLGAKAFTHSNHIYLGAGASADDRGLMAHELTHVVQQSGAQHLKRQARPAVAAPGSLSSGARLQRDTTDEVQINGRTRHVAEGDKQGLHETITDMVTAGTQAVNAQGTPKAYLLMGGPGSGKSSILDNLVPDRSNYVVADPDAVKSAMPEYRKAMASGDSSAASKVHGESKQITGGIVSQAISGRRNMIYDGTGGNKQEYEKMIASLKTAGYRTSLVMTHVALQEGLQRVALRANETGRRVPPSVVEDIYQWVPQNFKDLVGSVDEAYLYDNLGERDTGPQLVWQKSEGQIKPKELVNLEAKLKRIGSTEVLKYDNLEEKKNSLGQRSATFSKIKKLLAGYETTSDLNTKLMNLRIASALADDWLQKHGTDNPQAPSLQRMQREIKSKKYVLKMQMAAAETPDSKGGVFKHTRKEARMMVKEAMPGGLAIYPEMQAATVKLAKEYGLTEAEVLAVKVYTGDDYTAINAGIEAQGGAEGWLRGVGAGQKVERNQMDRFVKSAGKEAGKHGKHIDSALAKLPPWAGHPDNPGNQPLYRGEQFPEAEAKQIRKAGRRKFKSYVSTSRLKDRSLNGFVKPNTARPIGALWHINRYKTGKPIDQLAISNNRREAEVLFRPNTEFVIDSVSWTTKDHDSKSWKVMELQVHEDA